jgi:hypothetical protein
MFYAIQTLLGSIIWHTRALLYITLAALRAAAHLAGEAVRRV